MSERVRNEYSGRLGAAQRRLAERSRRAAWVSNLRLAVFGAGLVLAWQVFASRALDPLWLLLPGLAFAVLVAVHDRLLRDGARARRVAQFYEGGLSRLEDRWHGAGRDGGEFADPQHPYAEDLDLFGRGSLFELLCTARSHAGESALAAWLLHPAPPAELRQRQEAVTELRDRLGLREDLGALDGALRSGLHPEALRRWGEAPAALAAAPWLRRVAGLLPTLSLAAFGAWWLGFLPPLAVAVGLGLQSGFAVVLRRRVQGVLGELDLPARELELLAQLLSRVEAERFESEWLVRLRTSLDTPGGPPSRRIRALRTRLDLIDARRNQFFAPIGALLLWTTQLALSVERWRADCGALVGRWIEAVGRFEAITALAGYAYEHPDQPFPEILERGPALRAQGLFHPLLPRERAVANDLALGEEPSVLVVSGSNMSGKSTLLRTVGSNAVLAFAGAPVCARQLSLSPLAIGASIRVHDSLLEGRSRFYAEIQRLRRIVEISEGEGSALFLMDEILHGTNSHDRGIGAEAVVRALLSRGAIGLVTTHDLALARIADSLAPRGANVHFEDRLVDGEIAFDYRLRPGTVERSNALELMRAVGLEV